MSAMKERPILFSSAMVRAILAGTKTQTRRIVKPQPTHFVGGPGIVDGHGSPIERTPAIEHRDLSRMILCPYGQTGDRLWVREAWKAHTTFDHLPPRDLPSSHIWYLADDGYKAESRTRASMHMPRWASRITLQVAGVRVERLQDISEADALAEGIEFSERFRGYCIGMAEHFNSHDPRQSYLSLWEAINGAGSVEANPWVWVVEFRRIAQS